MGCKYRIMEKCKAKDNKDAFCFGKDNCPYYEDENTVKVTDVYKCMYCGAEINWGDSNNPSACCKYCNSITGINRNFKKLIEQPQEFNLWIQYIKDEISELESDKDKIIKHYLDVKRFRSNW